MPDGVLRLMQNCRLTREGRIEARPAFVGAEAWNAVGPAACLKWVALW